MDRSAFIARRAAHATHTWTPSDDAFVRGVDIAGRLHHTARARSIIAEGEQTQIAPAASVAELMTGVSRRFGLTPAGTRRSPPRNKAVGARRDPHEAGFACDVYVRGERGDAVSDWLVLNAEQLGLQLVLYSNVLWTLNPRNPWQVHQGGISATQRHEDHIHIEVSLPTRDWARGTMARLVRELP